MRRRTTILVGGAVAVALALGGLVGGVLAESRSATDTAGRSGGARRSERSPEQPAVSAPRRSRRSRRRCAHSHATRACSPSSASRTSCAGARPPTRRTSRARRRPAPCRPVRRRGRGRNRSASARSRSSSTSSEPRCATGAPHEKLLPGSSRPFGVMGDALVELGRYDDAFAAFERMVTLRPSLASYARIAYARELVGDREGAVEAMQLALDAAAGQPEPTAWANVELAKLELGLGDTRAARARVRAALRILPGYPSARVELARIEAAAGRTRRRDRAGAARGGCDPDLSVADRARRPSRARRSRGRGAQGSERRSPSSTACSTRTASRSTSSRR